MSPRPRQRPDAQALGGHSGTGRRRIRRRLHRLPSEKRLGGGDRSGAGGRGDDASADHARSRDPTSENVADAIPLVSECPLPLVPAVGSTSRTRIGCETCHNPHAGRGVRSLLRSPDPSHGRRKFASNATRMRRFWTTACTRRSVLAHATASPDSASPANSKLLCAPCHAVHAVEGSQRDKLWAGRLDFSAATPNEQRCFGCHDDQTAKRPMIPAHPSVVFGLLKWSAAESSHLPEYLPTERSIPCGVCHLPHGNSNSKEIPIAAAGTILSPQQLIGLRGATKPMMRSRRCA